MRLRGLVFESFGAFERAEVNLCDANGAPLDVVLFVGDSGSGKSALLRGISGLLAEAAGAADELGKGDVRRGADAARCRIVYDDRVDDGRVVITLEKEISRDPGPSALRASPPEAYARWRSALEHEAAPRAAFSIARGGHEHEAEEDLSDESGSADEDPLFDWFSALRGGSGWEGALRALDRILWPYHFDHVSGGGEIVFSTPTGLASPEELGDAFESVLVIALELLRLSTDRPNEELVYVIDDLDVHLHPRWQARIVGDLRRAFPQVQIVATTHSPFVVASVEPAQVFRIERSRQSEVVRIADRLQRGGAVSQVMDLAFAAPDLPGPKWLHSPSLAIRRELLQGIDGDLTRGAVVYALPEPIHVKDVRDAFGEPVLPFGIAVLGHLFFIDYDPGSSWGHACEYVFRTPEGKLARQRAIWPPANLDRFVAFGRG